MVGIKPRLVAVGGNSELSLARANSLREMSKGGGGGDLARLIFAGIQEGDFKGVSFDYFSWTGMPIEDETQFPIFSNNWNGANRIAKKLGTNLTGSPLILVGWSNGGDTAYNLAKKIGATTPVDALITLDPVSRITSSHWLPLVGPFEKPIGVKHWFHAYVQSQSLSGKFSQLDKVDRKGIVGIILQETGNLVAAVGGAWNSQPKADLDLLVSGDHGSTRRMLTEIVGSSIYQQFCSAIKGG